MYPLKVSGTDSGDVLVTQEWNDMNESNPEIVLSSEQAILAAGWILETASEGNEEASQIESIPANFYSRGPESEAQELKIYPNAHGMIILSIDEDTFVEVSPAMAKRLREQLTKAISSSLTDMLRGDESI